MGLTRRGPTFLGIKDVSVVAGEVLCREQGRNKDGGSVGGSNSIDALIGQGAGRILEVLLQACPHRGSGGEHSSANEIRRL